MSPEDWNQGPVGGRLTAKAHLPAEPETGRSGLAGRGPGRESLCGKSFRSRKPDRHDAKATGRCRGPADIWVHEKSPDSPGAAPNHTTDFPATFKEFAFLGIRPQYPGSTRPGPGHLLPFIQVLRQILQLHFQAETHTSLGWHFQFPARKHPISGSLLGLGGGLWAAQASSAGFWAGFRLWVILLNSTTGVTVYSLVRFASID